MSSSRYVGKRRAAPARRFTLPSVAGSSVARTAVKSVAGVGIVLGSGAFVIAPTSAIGGDTDTSALGAQQSFSASTLLAERGSEESGQETASRSAERTEGVAVTAPEAKGKNAESETGDIAVEPVAKPEPKPEPEPEPTEETPEPTEETPETDSAGAEPAEEATQETTSGGVNSGGYAAEAAALGLGPNASRVYSAVRNQFPDMTNIGGYRAGDPGDHGSGRAVDIMVTGARGDQVAAWLQQHSGELSIKYLIWKQRIWYPGSGTWEYMEDRGSATANHYDHVHVSVY